MADRKSLLSRFWPPSSSRRTSTTQTAAAEASPPPTATTSTPPPPRTPARQPTTKASSRTQTRKADRTSSASSKSPSGKVPTANQQTTTPTDSKTSSPSPSSSKPASPSRFSPRSRSPPSQPKRPSKTPSPSRLTSPSHKEESKLPVPATPSKGSTQPTETVSTSEAPTLASEEKETKPAPPQQEPGKKDDVKPDGNEVVNGLTREKTKTSQLSATPVQGPETGETIKSLDSSSGNEASTKMDHAKLEEPKDVKEVVQATTCIEADEETKKEVDDSGASKSVSAAAETPNKAEQMQTEKKKQTTIETPANGTASQPIKRSNNLGEQVPLHKNIEAKQMAVADPKRAVSDKPVNVITLAGENRGASMQMDSDSSKREAPIHIHRGYKINPDESPVATSDAEENSEEKRSGNERYMENQLTEAYVNNNAQGINNSIVFNSSIVEGNPGVHMVVTHLPKETVRSKDKTSFSQTRKAEVNMSHAEKLTYQPTVRRRCLRGLLLETSDSDEENPEKPRRHGCRVVCQKGDGENNVDVL